IDRYFRRSAEDGKDGAIPEEIDGVVAPFAGGDHAAVEAEDARQLAAVEGDAVAGGGGGKNAALAPAGLTRFGFAEGHAAPPCWAMLITNDRAGDAAPQEVRVT